MTKSEQMARIRGDDLKPETALRRALATAGLAFERNVRELPGSPDVVFREEMIAVQVHGCFFHSCPKHYREPKTNVEFWRKKISDNVRRDRRTAGKLRRAGWSVLTVWECDLHEVK